MKEFFYYAGGIVCLFAGILLLGLGSIPWGIIGGASLSSLAYVLATRAGEITGQRKGRLEERLKREKEQS